MKSLCTLALVLAAGLATAQDQLVGFEYWFDQNDAARLYADATNPDALLVESHDAMFSLAPGQHTIHYRLKDANARWSSVVFRPFTVHTDGPHQIESLRYWTDQANPFPTDMVIEAVQSPTQVLDILMNIDLCSHPDTGATTMFYQVRDEHGRWSSVLAWNFSVDAVGEAPALPVITGEGTVMTGSLYIYAAPSAGASWYEWALPNGWTGSSTADTIQVTVPGGATGDHMITVIAHNDCGSSEEATFPVTVSTMGIGSVASGAFGMYPNPTTGIVDLTYAGNRALQVNLYDTTGKRVHEAKQPAAHDQLTMDVSQLKSGTYLVECITDGVTHRSLLVVQH